MTTSRPPMLSHLPSNRDTQLMDSRMFHPSRYVLSFARCLCVFISGSLVCPMALGADDALPQPGGGTSSEAKAADIEFFEKRIRPVLHDHCYECHSSDAKIVRGGLLVDHREALLDGGDSGPAIVPGAAEESFLIDALRHESWEMPPDKQLDEAIINDFVHWIDRGAVDPRLPPAEAAEGGIDPTAAREHWAFQPLTGPEVPRRVPAESDWIENPIDAFVLAKLEQQEWHPAAPVDDYTWIRRATFDLTGCPPTSQEIRAFLDDDSPNRFEKVIDRLLASPHYGQRWGRHWLDLVRYADSNGADENHALPDAWRYRDWVFQAMNRDLPFNAFITQQLAGDLLVRPEQDEQRVSELLTATGLLVIGPKMLAEQDKVKMQADIVDEQIDTVTRTMLGMTIACARCHDHKFDPIAAEDYYALAGIFASTRTMADQAFVSSWLVRPLPSAKIDTAREQHQQKIDEAQQRRDRLVGEAEAKLLEEKDLKELPENPAEHFPEGTSEAIAKADKAIEELKEAMPQYDHAMAVEEADPVDVAVHIRGDHLRLADAVTPRGAPQRLTEVTPMPPIPEDRSGRLRFAEWLTAPDHPLTSRVMVNRLWMWHFGQPLMQAPSNFGLQSDPPLHLDLLNWMARRFIDDGWSIKRMHRLIMLSQTYRMSSRSTSYSQQDPENKWLWRQHRRRLEVEPLRDAILQAGNSLDRQFGGPGQGIDSHRQTVYLTINRAALFELFSTFDYVETANHIEQRPVTTVPHQALFLLNSSLVQQQAQRLAEVLMDQPNDEARIETLWMRLHGRPPRDDERDRAIRFVGQVMSVLPNDQPPPERAVAAWASLCRTLFAGNRFSYVD